MRVFEIRVQVNELANLQHKVHLDKKLDKVLQMLQAQSPDVEAINQKLLACAHLDQAAPKRASVKRLVIDMNSLAQHVMVSYGLVHHIVGGGTLVRRKWTSLHQRIPSSSSFLLFEYNFLLFLLFSNFL